MNTLNLTHNAGYPFDVAFLAFMQNTYSLFNHLGSLAGNLAIISGCEEVGNTISPGAVYIKGELLPFEGGTKGDTVFIKEVTNEVTFEDGFLRPLETVRSVTFGHSTPEKTFAWDSFKRVSNLQELGENKTENTETKKLLKRIEKLEKQKEAVPIGLVAIWGKPASQIPEGWQEYTPLQGVMPIGYDPDYERTPTDAKDYRLNVLQQKGGTRSHTLTEAEMPAHTHNYNDIYYSEKWGTVATPRGEGSGSSDDGNKGYEMPRTTAKTGGNQPHDNMPPYRVVQFIEYVGFPKAKDE